MRVPGLERFVAVGAFLPRNDTCTIRVSRQAVSETRLHWLRIRDRPLTGAPPALAPGKAGGVALGRSPLALLGWRGTLRLVFRRTVENQRLEGTLMATHIVFVATFDPDHV